MQNYFKSNIRLAKKTQVVIFFVAAFFAFVILHTSIIILPVYVIELGGTEFDSGLQSTLFFLLAVVLRIYFGPLADSKGRKIPLLIGAFVFATSPLLFMISQEAWHLLFARLYQAIALATFLASGSSLVADLAPDEFKGTYIGAYRFIITFALLVGPAVGMAIIQSFGYGFWFLTNVFMGGVAFFLILFFISQSSEGFQHKVRAIDSYGIVLKNRQLWPVFSGIAVASLAYGALMTFGTLFIQQYGIISNPGIYFTYFGLAGIGANLLAGYLSDRFGRKYIVWLAQGLLGIGLILLSFAPNITTLALVSGLLAGLGWSGGIAALVAWIVDLVEEKVRATALSVQESIIDSFIAFGAFFFGIVAAGFGMPTVFVLSGIIILIANACIIYVTRHA